MKILISVLLAFSVPSPASAADIEFATQELPWAIVDKPYSPPPLEARSSGACPLGGVAYVVVSGVLPPGTQLSRLGVISGTPRRTGSWEVAVRVSNGCTWTARHYVLVVTGAAVLTVTPTAIVLEGAATATLRVSATWPKLTYSVTSNAAWLTATAERGFTPREGSALDADFVQVRTNAVKLPPGRHFAQLTFSAWQAAAPFVVEVQLVIPPASTGIPTSASQP